ncbi:CHAT domain-containing protein [Acidovorax sp. BL-A-41-H1]|uniref:CHAT domain-containing protein n=1 Tax=Acidovorax sp. BL-A-41-H1 TaxID=3421102 RepID=UPI003F7ACED3
MSTSAIQHIIAMPTDVAASGQTFFQGFALALIPDYLAIMDMLVRFPHDMVELGLAGDAFIASKIAGSALCIRMLRADLLTEGHAEVGGLPTVIWSTDKSAADVEARLHCFAVRPLHITLNRFAGAVSMADLSADAIYGHLLALAERTAAHDSSFQVLVELMKARPPADREQGLLPFVPKLHNCTKPSAAVLRLYGYNLDNSEVIEPTLGRGIEAHIDAIVEFSEMIDQLRQGLEVYALRKNDAIIFCASIYALLYKIDNKIWNPILRDLDRDKRNFVKAMLVRSRGYGNGSITFAGTKVEDFNPYADPVVGPLLKHRQFEQRFFSTVIAVLAANQFVPAFRLPDAVMLHHDRLSEIYSLVSSNKPTRLAELNRHLAEYSGEIRSEVGEKLWKAMFDGRERLLTICDFPIEWLSIDGLPAMFRYEMSRIPSTPGNVAVQVALAHPRITVPKMALDHILVIRSFAPDDPIRSDLELAIAKYDLGEMKVEIVDVSTRDELIDAMNAHQGVMVIFDCHGNHGGKTQPAWLQIGKEKVDVWDLKHVARMTHIVVLAACSTHPVDGSHASVANGFLANGVQSVLGTYAPVDSRHTAIFVGRLLYRVAAYLPLISKDRPVNWREIVGSFFRMSYVTDVLQDLLEVRKVINETQYRKLHYEANMAINGRAPDWLEKLQQGVADFTAMEPGDVSKIWAARYQFVETMLFGQFGQPENIFIVSNDSYSEVESDG